MQLTLDFTHAPGIKENFPIGTIVYHPGTGHTGKVTGYKIGGTLGFILLIIQIDSKRNREYSPDEVICSPR